MQQTQSLTMQEQMINSASMSLAVCRSSPTPSKWQICLARQHWLTWQDVLPVGEVGVVEDVGLGVVVVKGLGAEHQGHAWVIQFGQHLHEELRLGQHVRIKDAQQLQGGMLMVRTGAFTCMQQVCWAWQQCISVMHSSCR